MPHPTAVLNIVGLTEALLGPGTPKLSAFARRYGVRSLVPALPAVTCTSQACMLTGAPPSTHGIIANGWYDRDLGEIHFWKQSNRLIQSPKVWETARIRDPSITTANLFWWFNMFSSADFAATPRPIYTADGRKIPDCLTTPPEWRNRLQSRLGRFPLFSFWGPKAGIESTRWIAEAAMEFARAENPTLLLVYLPHLDYILQKAGPESPDVRPELEALDEVVGCLLEAFEQQGRRILIVSEYGIESVNRPVAINRILREHGILSIRDELGHDMLDLNHSRAFAVADHQVAHVYVHTFADVSTVRSICEKAPGVEQVLDQADLRARQLFHPRSGDLLLVAEPGAWFTYDFWLDDARAPDYAHTVDIHRKPGYDPRELFIDPAIASPAIAVGRRLLMKKLGFRTLMDVIPLDATLVRGSHGRIANPRGSGPIMMSSQTLRIDTDSLPMTGVHDAILDCLLDA